MSDADRSEEQFALLLVVAMGLLTVSVVVVDGQAATYAGVLIGIGLIGGAGLLRYRESRAEAGER